MQTQRITVEAPDMGLDQISHLRANLGTEQEVKGRIGILIAVDPPFFTLDLPGSGDGGKEVI